MNKLLIFTFVIFTSFSTGIAQNLNSYKYVILPEEYAFLKEENQYQLNALTKFLFKKNGFDAYFKNEEYPGSTGANGCEMLFADVKDHSGIFSTKLELILKDCRNNIVFSSEGMSKEKDYKVAYHEALREAFEAVEALNYRYEPENDLASANEDEEKNISEPEEQIEGEIKETPEDELEKADLPVSEAQAIKTQATAGNKVFIRDNVVFILKKSENGYTLFQEGMGQPFAALIASKTGDNYIYSSITSQGIAYFNEQGNLVVEILNKETNSTDTTEYILQDQ